MLDRSIIVTAGGACEGRHAGTILLEDPAITNVLEQAQRAY